MKLFAGKSKDILNSLGVGFIGAISMVAGMYLETLRVFGTEETHKLYSENTADVVQSFITWAIFALILTTIYAFIALTLGRKVGIDTAKSEGLVKKFKGIPEICLFGVIACAYSAVLALLDTRVFSDVIEGFAPTAWTPTTILFNLVDTVIVQNIERYCVFGLFTICIWWFLGKLAEKTQHKAQILGLICTILFFTTVEISILVGSYTMTAVTLLRIILDFTIPVGLIGCLIIKRGIRTAILVHIIYILSYTALWSFIF